MKSTRFIRFYLLVFADARLNLFCQNLPLVLYIMWISSRNTHLGRHYLKLKANSQVPEQWALEMPLCIRAITSHKGDEERVTCLNINLGPLALYGALLDLEHCFHCKVNRETIYPMIPLILPHGGWPHARLSAHVLF